MDDITPKLLNAIKNTYEKEISSNQLIKEITSKIKKGNADYEDMLKYSKELGKCLSKAFQENISDEVLPDSKMYYNIAKSLIEPMCKENYKAIASHCAAVQTSLNQKAKIGIKGIKPTYKQEKTDGIINYISNANKYSEREKSFLQSLSTNAKSIVDDSVKENADLHFKSGLSPKIIRRTSGKTCKWCQNLAGVYDYADVSNTRNDVFRRHANCDCVVVYDPSDGSKKVQDVWSKKIIYKKDIVLNSDKMGRKTIFDIDTRKSKGHLITYKNDKYKNIYCQTNTKNAQKMSELLDKMINQSKQYGDVSKIIVVKNKALQGIASYDHVKNNLYISEELINPLKFSSLVDRTYFPSMTIEDILNHELGGHKRHWDAIKRYQKKYGISIDRAKEELEEKLRKYVVNQKNSDILYVKRYVSRNADDKLEKASSLNELIADVNVLYKQGKIKEEYLYNLVMEVLNYDG